MFRGSTLGTAVIAILVAIMIAAVAAWLFGFDMPGDDETFSREAPRVVALLALLIVIGVPMLLGRRHRVTGLLKGLGIWLLLGVVLVTAYAYRADLQQIGARVLGTLLPGTTIAAADGTITVVRDPRDQYRVSARVNGAPVDFLFDTGASAVTLTAADARAAGLATERLSYSVPVSTANGRGRMAAVRLDMLEIGTIRLSNVRAFVAPERALDTSLLGLTALDRLSSWRVEANRLILEP